MLIYNGQIIAGGGTIVLPMTRAEYEANKAILDSADVWVDLTDEPDQVATADQIAYSVDGVQKGMGYIGDIATKAIAKVEPTDTALYLHEVGTGFINKDGDYCITDVQISVGGTITLGTNCHVVDGGISSKLYSNLTDGWTTLNANIDYCVRGNVVYVKIKNTTQETLGTLPSSLAPDIGIFFSINDPNTTNNAYGYINPSGIVEILSSTVGWLTTIISYPKTI